MKAFRSTSGVSAGPPPPPSSSHKKSMHSQVLQHNHQHKITTMTQQREAPRSPSTPQSPMDEAGHFSIQLEDIIKNKSYRACYLKFLESSRCTEPLLFVEEIEKYTKLETDEHRYRKAKEIMRGFVLQCGSVHELNLSQELREQTTTHFLQTMTPTRSSAHFFDRLLVQVMVQLKEDSYYRFLRSELYAQCLDEERRQQQLVNNNNLSEAGGLDQDCDEKSEGDHRRNSNTSSSTAVDDDDDVDDEDSSLFESSVSSTSSATYSSSPLPNSSNNQEHQLSAAMQKLRTNSVDSIMSSWDPTSEHGLNVKTPWFVHAEVDKIIQWTQSPLSVCGTEWKLTTKKNGATAYITRRGVQLNKGSRKTKLWKLVGELPASCDQVFRSVMCSELRQKNDGNLNEVTYLTYYQASMPHHPLSTSLTLEEYRMTGLANRRFIFCATVREERTEQGWRRIVIARKCLQKHEMVPESKSIITGECTGGYVFEQANAENTKTRYYEVGAIDIKGALPTWLLNLLVSSRGVAMHQGMKKSLEEYPKKERVDDVNYLTLLDEAKRSMMASMTNNSSSTTTPT